MKKKSFRILGVFAVVVGLAVFANSLSPITGLAIVEGEEAGSAGSILSVLLIIGGIALYLIGQREEAPQIPAENKIEKHYEE